MGINPEALYLSLLQDLSEHLTEDQFMDLSIKRSTTWSPDASAKQVAAVQLGNSFMKKFTDGSSELADATCLAKFCIINEKCKNWKLQLDNSAEEVLLGELKTLLYNFFYPNGKPLISSLNQILDHGRVGPGASVAAKGDDFYTKLFDGNLSSTCKGLYTAYGNYFEDYPLWRDAEYLREARYGAPKIVAGNRLSFVPKNVDTSRSICTEPSLNMFYQLGLGAILEKRLRQYFGIDFAFQQEINRDLARLGSLDFKEQSDATRDGLVTIDLSSASDSLALKMLEEVLPPMVYRWFVLLRSPTTTLPNGSVMDLNMVSTMGNGFTFPLQTILFSCVVIAASRLHYRTEVRSKDGRPGTWGVFGDDIICGKAISRQVIRLLNILGFEVNHDKSFLEGPFRESCGADFYNGQQVRGVYCKTLKQPHNRYAVINQLNLWTSKCGIPLPLTVGHLRNSVKYLPVPVWENDDAGIRMPYYLLPGMSRNSHYQSLAYKRWCVRPRRLKVGDGEVSVPRGEKNREYNAHGLMLAFLRGSIEQGYITIRQRTVLYSQRTGIAPNWDATPTGPALPAGITLSNFGFSVAINLGL